MTKWQKDPPTVKQWRTVGGYGYWWIKFLIIDSETDFNKTGKLVYYPEFWHTEIVQITSSPKPGRNLYESLKDDNACMLHARVLSSRKELDLKELAKDPNTYWQPVKSPDEDEEYSRPNI